MSGPFRRPTGNKASGAPGPVPVFRPPRPTSANPPADWNDDDDRPTVIQAEATSDPGLSTAPRSRQLLVALMQAAEQIGAAVRSARYIEEALATELEHLAPPASGATDAEVASLRKRVEELEQGLEAQRREAKRERTFLLEEQDNFLVGLIEEYEASVAKANRERDEVLSQVRQLQRVASKAAAAARESMRSSKPPPSSVPLAEHEKLKAELAETRATVDKLNDERERGVDLVRRLQHQRDDAQRKLAALLKEMPAPPAGLSSRPTDPSPPHDSQRSLAIDEAWGDPLPAPPPSMGVSMSSTPPSMPIPAPRSDRNAAPSARPTPPQSRRPTPPPDELRAAILTPAPPGPERPTRPSARPVPAAFTGKPPLKERPLVGYSLQPEEIEPEFVGANHVGTSKPPRR